VSSPARIIFRVNWEEKEGRELWSVFPNSTRYEQLSPVLGQAERESRVLFPNRRQQFLREARGPCQRAFHRAGCCSLTGGRQRKLSLLATLEQVQAHRFAEGLLATVDVQFAVETAELGLDRVG
jgi:hypothetical protein